MAIIRKKELHQMGAQALGDKLFEMRKELNLERGKIAGGARASNPGRIKELKRTVARILTIMPAPEVVPKQAKKEEKKMPSAKSKAAGTKR